MNKINVKKCRNIFLILANVFLLIVIFMFTQPFAIMKGTGECVYTGFELTFGKSKEVFMGLYNQTLELVEFNTTMTTILVLIVFYFIMMFVSFRKDTKYSRFIIISEMFFVILAGVEIYLLQWRASYTASSIPVEDLENGIGTKFSVILCLLSESCLLIRAIFFREKNK